MQSLWLHTRTLGGALGIEIRRDLYVPRNLWLKRAIDLLVAVPVCVPQFLERGSRRYEPGRSAAVPSLSMSSFDREFQRVRESVPPGLTGLWQISSRSDGDLQTQKHRTCSTFEIGHLARSLYHVTDITSSHERKRGKIGLILH
jgi:hypothetical protein